MIGIQLFLQENYKRSLGRQDGLHSKEICQGKMVCNQNQKYTLLTWFEHNPYPDKSTREQLAKQLDILASKIKNLFKRQRATHRKIESKCSLGKCKTYEHNQSQLCTQDVVLEAKISVL
jgi:hypothetical protein